MPLIMICDDNELHAHYAEEMIRNAFPDKSLTIRLFADGTSLLNGIREKDVRPDLAILDVELSEENGIGLAAKLNETVPECRIIFLTGYPEYASDAYTTKHVWFVLKEKADVFLIPAVKRALFEKGPGACMEPVVIKSDGKSFPIPADDILYIDRYGRKARIFSKQGQFMTGTPPQKLIPDSLKDRFIRCHQGYWVNLSHIDALEHNEFVLDSGERIPISRTKKEEARSRFFDRYR